MSVAPVSPLVPLFITQALFGVLYALLIHWLSVNEYLPGSTAYSVVVGDAATLFIQWIFLRDEWTSLITFASFACSGFPMVVSYLFRHQQKVLSHKAPAVADRRLESPRRCDHGTGSDHTSDRRREGNGGQRSTSVAYGDRHVEIGMNSFG